jgi:hypothetical protein
MARIGMYRVKIGMTPLDLVQLLKPLPTDYHICMKIHGGEFPVVMFEHRLDNLDRGLELEQ